MDIIKNKRAQGGEEGGRTQILNWREYLYIYKLSVIYPIGLDNLTPNFPFKYEYRKIHILLELLNKI